MQVKKFEAPTIQEALETIKRELGPEAIILQTKKHKRGFGLMSRSSVEVTAAVSERAIQKKSFTEKKLPDAKREQLQKLTARSQAEVFDSYAERHAAATRDKVDLARKKPMTQARYADIQEDGSVAQRPAPRAPQPAPEARTTATVQGRAQYGMPQQQAPSAVARATQAAIQAGNQARESGAVSAVGNHGMPIDEELKHLKRMIAEMKSVQEESALSSGAQSASGGRLSTPALRDAFEQLLLNGVDKRYAIQILKKVAFELGEERSNNPDEVLDQLAAEIMETTEVASAFTGVGPRARTETLIDGDAASSAPAARGPALVALVGPTGVGKTTTIAKMASEAILRRNLKVGLINLDSYKVAAFDQLATYAKILNVPFRSVATVEDLKVAVEDFKALDLVIIDTTGRSQKDPESLKGMKDMLDAVSARTQIVLSATTRDTELYDMAGRFSIFRPQGVVFSKLDEATTYGAIYNVTQKTKLPLIYFTTGQRVPEDIEEASRERVCALIMDL